LETFVENLFKASKQLKSYSNISYLQQTIDAVLNRLNFIFNPINFEVLGVGKSTLNFSLLDNGKTIILDLSQLQKRAARPSDIFLICNLILKMFYRFAASKEMTNKLRYMVILEEAINIIPNFYRSESSASLITSENNFLLGRSLGIGHITISQLWDSVSNVVHGNSATKIIFRSSEKSDLIGKALSLNDDEIIQIQRLPTQHCYIFLEGLEKATQIKTLDLMNDPLNFSEYNVKMQRRFGRSDFPLLYNNFIDMRTALYQKNVNLSSNEMMKDKNIKKTDSSQHNLDRFWIKDGSSSTIEKDNQRDNETMEIINSAEIIPENLICERLCPEKTNDRECLKYKIGANIIETTLVSNKSKKEIGSLLGDEEILFSEIQNIAKKRNLDFDNYLIFCAVKELVLNLVSDNIIYLDEAYDFLKRFSPKAHAFII
jgi:hypothetical protein